MALLVATGMASSSSSSVAAPGLLRSSFSPLPHPTPCLVGAKVARKTTGLAVTCAASDQQPKDWVRNGAVALGAAAMVLLSPPLALADEAADPPPFQTYYGTAASASSYGGYGGNANKKDSAEYIFDVPQVLGSLAHLCVGNGFRNLSSLVREGALLLRNGELDRPSMAFALELKNR